MSALPPLNILLFRCPDSAEVRIYEDALVRAFLGGKEAGASVAAGAELGVQMELFPAAPRAEPGTLLDGFSHTLVVVLVDDGLLGEGDGLMSWLAACVRHTASSAGRHGLLILSLGERAGEAFACAMQLNPEAVLPVKALGESAIRGAMAALRALHEARVLLAVALTGDGDEPAGYLRLFISHAKFDGLPLAQALKHRIQATGWLRTYYDVEDLDAESDWHAELERGVGSSLIIMLRTEAYDSRYWCQREVRWADEHAVPAVLVEARTGLDHVGGTLPYDRLPTVRIPDGNLMRILHLAVREGLRTLVFERRVKAMRQAGDLPPNSAVRVFSYQPSMAALLKACRALAGLPAPHFILYPDPVLGTGAYEAARALVDVEAPGTVLATPDTLAVVSL